MKTAAMRLEEEAIKKPKMKKTRQRKGVLATILRTCSADAGAASM